MRTDLATKRLGVGDLNGGRDGGAIRRPRSKPVAADATRLDAGAARVEALRQTNPHHPRRAVGRDQGGDVIVVETLGPRYDDDAHLPGAITRLAPQLLPDKAAAIVTYCSNTPSHH